MTHASHRCEFVLGNFFEIAANGMDVGADAPDQFDAIIVDIDHSPRHLLDPSNAPFYEADGVERLARCIRPGGVFSLWSNDPPDAEYLAVLNGAFDTAVAEVVVFDNVLTGGTAESTIYVATV
jgi:spermidine synthase